MLVSSFILAEKELSPLDIVSSIILVLVYKVATI